MEILALTRLARTTLVVSCAVRVSSGDSAGSGLGAQLGDASSWDTCCRGSPFLKPGDAVRGTDALVTNFHLPGSSLFMLVSALMGTDVMRAAYDHAIANEYRFYSYGDACLLLP